MDDKKLTENEKLAALLMGNNWNQDNIGKIVKDIPNTQNQQQFYGNSQLGQSNQMPPSQMQEFLNRLQLSGGMGASQQPGVKSISGGGRAGYNFPMEEGNLNAGVGFGGYKTKVDVPGFKQTMKDFGVNNIDAEYSSGQNTLGGNYQMNPQGKDGFNMYYKRKF
jgi:hypothetical protein